VFKMSDFLIRVLGTLLKGVYLLPFINFYLLSKRKNEFILDNSYKIILIGLILGIINIIMLMIINYLSFVGILNASTSNIDTVFFYQIIINILLLSSYALLLIGMYKLSKKEVSRSDLINMISFIVLINIITVFTKDNMLFRINLITYFVTIYLLINNFVLTNFFLKDYEKKHYLVIIGAFILMIDPLVYSIMYDNLYSTFPDFTGFYYYRQILYLVGAVSISLVLTPNLGLLIKLRKKETVSYNKKDSLVENTIKRLLNETQKIYGNATNNLFQNANSSFQEEFDKKIEYNGNFSFKNLKYKEQKEYLKILFRVYIKILSRSLTIGIIKRIMDHNNDGLMIECFPKNVLSPHRIEPDTKFVEKLRKMPR